jgi:hypothetical protein
VDVVEAELLGVGLEHVLDKGVLLVVPDVIGQPPPELLQLVVQERPFDNLPLLLAVAQLPGDVLHPSLEFLFVLGHFVEVGGQHLDASEFGGRPVVLEVAHEDVEDLQPVDVEFVRVVVVHVGEDELAGLVDDEEERVEGVVVVAQRRTAADGLQLLHALLLHQEADVLRAQPVVALALH